MLFGVGGGSFGAAVLPGGPGWGGEGSVAVSFFAGVFFLVFFFFGALGGGLGGSDWGLGGVVLGWWGVVCGGFLGCGGGGGAGSFLVGVTVSGGTPQ